MEVQAVPGEDRDVFGKLRRIGVLGFGGLRPRLLLLLGAVE